MGTRKRKSHLRRLLARLCADEGFAFALERRLLGNILEDPFTGCWEWQRRLAGNSSGGDLYGMLSVRLPDIAHPVPFRVHVLASVLFNGPVDYRQVRAHRCDNTLCCNPEHIESKSQSDNINDSISRFRHSSWKNLNYFGSLGDRRAPGADVPF